MLLRNRSALAYTYTGADIQAVFTDTLSCVNAVMCSTIPSSRQGLLSRYTGTADRRQLITASGCCQPGSKDDRSTNRFIIDINAARMLSIRTGVSLVCGSSVPRRRRAVPSIHVSCTAIIRIFALYGQHVAKSFRYLHSARRRRPMPDACVPYTSS